MMSQGLSRYVFGDRDEYEIQVANTIEQRIRAWRLIYTNYLKKDYVKPNAEGLWYGMHDALPETTTLLVTRDGQDAATLSLVFDSAFGVPADKLYRHELDQLRSKNRRLCEIISLASDDTSRQRCVEVLKHMFKLAYLTARHLEQATDFVITVNPRHMAHHERVLLFRQVGRQRCYGKVGGAPAVLMNLDLETAEARYRKKYSWAPKSFFRFFVDPDTNADLVRFLENNRRASDRASLEQWLAQRGVGPAGQAADERKQQEVPQEAVA